MPFMQLKLFSYASSLAQRTGISIEQLLLSSNGHLRCISGAPISQEPISSSNFWGDKRFWLSFSNLQQPFLLFLSRLEFYQFCSPNIQLCILKQLQKGKDWESTAVSIELGTEQWLFNMSTGAKLHQTNEGLQLGVWALSGVCRLLFWTIILNTLSSCQLISFSCDT